MNILNKIIKSRGFKQFIVEVCIAIGGVSLAYFTNDWFRVGLSVALCYIGDTLFTKWFTLKENNA